jgi:hypothetical protein
MSKESHTILFGDRVEPFQDSIAFVSDEIAETHGDWNDATRTRFERYVSALEPYRAIVALEYDVATELVVLECNRLPTSRYGSLERRPSEIVERSNHEKGHEGIVAPAKRLTPAPKLVR